MIDESTNSSGVNPNVPGGNADAANPVTQEQQQKPQTVSYDSFTKLLNEKKAKDAELLKYKEKEKADLEKSGEFRALYEAEKAQREELETRAREEKANYAFSNVSAQFRAEAARLGCTHPEALQKLVDLKELAKKTDSNFAVDPTAMKSLLERAQKESPFLFAKEAAGFRDSAPTNGAPKTLSYEDWQKLPLAEKKARMGEVMKASTNK